MSDPTRVTHSTSSAATHGGGVPPDNPFLRLIRTGSPPPEPETATPHNLDNEASDDDAGAPPPENIDDATRRVQAKLPPNRRFEPYDKSLYPAGFHSTPELLRKIFDYSDVTRTIFHTARDRRPRSVHPMSLLAQELLRRGSRCPVNLRLWAGTPPSTFVVIAGRSGLGKSESAKPDASPWPDLKASTFLANAAARKVMLSAEDMATYQARLAMTQSYQAAMQPNTSPPKGGRTAQPANPGAGPVNSGSGNSGTASPAPPVLIPYDFDATTSLGSGQVLSDHLVDFVGKGENAVLHMAPHPCAFIAEDEMTTMLRAAKGDTSTIISTLNTAWAGMPLGNKTRMHGDRRTNGPYSVFITTGLQPKLCHELFCHDDSGFLQRFVFVATADPYILANEPVIPVPTVKPSGAMPVINAGDTFTADPKVIADVSDPGVDYQLDHLYDDYAEMMSHASQVRIRLACLGALLHGTLHVSRELWEWAGWIMEHSRRVFAWMEGQAKERARQQAHQAGEHRAIRMASAEDFREREVRRVAKVLYRAVKAVGETGITYGRWRGKLNGKSTDDRKVWFGPAVTYLLREGLVRLDGERYKATAAVADFE